MNKPVKGLSSQSPYNFIGPCYRLCPLKLKKYNMEEANKDINFASPMEEAKYWREKVRNDNSKLLMYYYKFNNFRSNLYIYDLLANILGDTIGKRNKRS